MRQSEGRPPAAARYRGGPRRPGHVGRGAGGRDRVVRHGLGPGGRPDRVGAVGVRRVAARPRRRGGRALASPRPSAAGPGARGPGGAPPLPRGVSGRLRGRRGAAGGAACRRRAHGAGRGGASALARRDLSARRYVYVGQTASTAGARAAGRARARRAPGAGPWAPVGAGHAGWRGAVDWARGWRSRPSWPPVTAHSASGGPRGGIADNPAPALHRHRPPTARQAAQSVQPAAKADLRGLGGPGPRDGRGAIPRPTVH